MLTFADATPACECVPLPPLCVCLPLVEQLLPAFLAQAAA